MTMFWLLEISYCLFVVLHDVLCVEYSQVKGGPLRVSDQDELPIGGPGKFDWKNPDNRWNLNVLVNGGWKGVPLDQSPPGPLFECGDRGLKVMINPTDLINIKIYDSLGNLLSLNQLTAFCGYFSKNTLKDVHLLFNYNSCYVKREETAYLLSLSWYGTDRDLSCPVPKHLPAVECKDNGIELRTRDVAPEELSVLVNGELAPLLYVADRCWQRLLSAQGGPMFLIPYSTCGVNFRDGQFVLSLRYKDQAIPLSCSRLPVPVKDRLPGQARDQDQQVPGGKGYLPSVRDPDLWPSGSDTLFGVRDPDQQPPARGSPLFGAGDSDQVSPGSSNPPGKLLPDRRYPLSSDRYPSTLGRDRDQFLPGRRGSFSGGSDPDEPLGGRDPGFNRLKERLARISQLLPPGYFICPDGQDPQSQQTPQSPSSPPYSNPDSPGTPGYPGGDQGIAIDSDTKGQQFPSSPYQSDVSNWYGTKGTFVDPSSSDWYPKFVKQPDYSSQYQIPTANPPSEGQSSQSQYQPSLPIKFPFSPLSQNVKTVRNRGLFSSRPKPIVRSVKGSFTSLAEIVPLKDIPLP